MTTPAQTMTEYLSPKGKEDPLRDRSTTPPSWVMDTGSFNLEMKHPLVAALREKIEAFEKNTTKLAMTVYLPVELLE